MIDAGQASVVQDGGGVEQGFAPVGEAHDRGQPSRVGQKTFQGLAIGRHETLVEQQILRRIAGQGQLGKQQHVDPRVARPPEVLHDLGRVALDVTHREIDLGQGDPELGHAATSTACEVVVHYRIRSRRRQNGRGETDRSAPPNGPTGVPAWEQLRAA